MKINFDASYKDLQNVTGAAATAMDPARRAPGFGKLLSSLSPESTQRVENKAVIMPMKATTVAQTLVNSAEKGPMASFNFSLPELKTAALHPLEPVLPPVIETSESVKTPAVLEARRIPSTGAALADRMAAVRDLVLEAGRSQGIDPALGMSVVANESSFDAQAISRDGFASKGLFQLLDATGTRMRDRLGVNEKYDPYDPEQNIKLGIGYLRYLHEIFSSDTSISDRAGTSAAANSSSLEKLAVAAFNAGEGRVASAQRRAKSAGRDPGKYEDIEHYLPEITQKYVHKVLISKAQFEGMFTG